MTTYADSSALLPLYVPEQFSEAADAELGSAGQIPFTAIHQLEISNALQRLVGRKLMSGEECRSVHQLLRDDLHTQRLLTVSLDLDSVFTDAWELSARYAAKHLARSLDLLHIAAAHAIECARFVSADDRQLAVARATGLTTVDITRSAPQKR